MNVDRALEILLANVQAHGREVTFTSYAKSYSGATGINTRTPTAHAAMVFPPYSKARFQPGDAQARVGTQMVLPNTEDGLAFTPTTSMKVVDGSVTWTISRVEPLETDNVLLAWVLHLSQGGAA